MQLDANKRREAELQKLRRDLEEAHAQNETQVSSLRKKQQDTMNEMSEQLEALQKMKQKYDIFATALYFTMLWLAVPVIIFRLFFTAAHGDIK